MTQWFESTVDFVDLFGPHSISLTFFGHSTQVPWLEAAHDSTVSWKLESIQLMTQVASQELTQNQLMTQVDYPDIDSYWLMIQSASPFFDSNQLMTQLKNIWSWGDSLFDSESYPCLDGVILPVRGSPANRGGHRYQNLETATATFRNLNYHKAPRSIWTFHLKNDGQLFLSCKFRLVFKSIEYTNNFFLAYSAKKLTMDSCETER